MPMHRPKPTPAEQIRVTASIVGIACGERLLHQMTALAASPWADGKPLDPEVIISAGGLLLVCPHDWGPGWSMHPLSNGSVRIDLRLDPASALDAEIRVYMGTPSDAHYLVNTPDGRVLYFGEPKAAAAYLRELFPSAAVVEA